jgi:glycosyltransferase involved in cell wall biosynthesis
VVASHPIQYQAPLFRRLAADPRVDLHVLFLSRHGLTSRADPDFGVDFSWDIDLLGGYASSFLKNLRERARPGGALSYVNPGVIGALRRLAPDAVLFQGARNATSLAAVQWARRAGVVRLYRAESSVLNPRGARSRLAAKGVLRSMTAVLPIGTANDLYYDQLGVPEATRHLAPYTVDNAFFRARNVSPGLAREQLGVAPDEVVLLYAGKLLPRKSLATLIEAGTGLGPRVRVLIAGDGPTRPELEALARRRNVKLTVLGFLNQTEMPRAYGAADVLVLPSLDEPWGLVVNEAMCYGVPPVVSSQVGARLDLVIPGVTGAVFRAGDPADLRRALAPLVASEDTRRAYGEAAMRRIGSWDIPDTADGVVRAVETYV